MVCSISKAICLFDHRTPLKTRHLKGFIPNNTCVDDVGMFGETGFITVIYLYDYVVYTHERLETLCVPCLSFLLKPWTGHTQFTAHCNAERVGEGHCGHLLHIDDRTLVLNLEEKMQKYKILITIYA